MSSFEFDIKEILVRVFKYLFEGVIVALAAYFVPSKVGLDGPEILLIGLIAALKAPLLMMAWKRA